GSDRRPGEQEPLPVLDAVAGSPGAVCGGDETREGAAAGARDRRSDDRPCCDQPTDKRVDQPRSGGGDGRDGEWHRRRVLRRILSALGVDYLRGCERIQSAPRIAAAIPGGSVGAVVSVLQGIADVDTHNDRRDGRATDGKCDGDGGWLGADDGRSNQQRSG